MRFTRPYIGLYTPIDVLLGANSLRDCAFALSTDVRAQRQLHEDTAHGSVVVELLHDLDDFLDGGILWEVDMLELDADLFSSLGFHAHVHVAVWPRAGLYDDELWLEAGVARLEGFNPGSDILSD